MDGLRVLEDRHYIKWIKEFGYGVYSLTNPNNSSNDRPNDSYILRKLGQSLSVEDYNKLKQPFIPAIDNITLNMRILAPHDNSTTNSTTNNAKYDSVEEYVLTTGVGSAILSPLHLFSAVIEYMKLIGGKQTDIFFIGIYELNVPPSQANDMETSQIFIDYGIRTSTSLTLQATLDDVITLFEGCRSGSTKDNHELAYQNYDNNSLTIEEAAAITKRVPADQFEEASYKSKYHAGTFKRRLFSYRPLAECLARGLITYEMVTSSDPSTLLSIAKCIMKYVFKRLDSTVFSLSLHYLQNKGVTDIKYQTINTPYSRYKYLLEILSNYISYGYDQVNRILASQPLGQDLPSGQINDLNMLVSLAPLINDSLTIYRGGFGIDDIKKYFEYDETTDLYGQRTIGSYTLLKTVARSFSNTIWALRIKPKQRILVVAGTLGLSEEAEVLLPRGSYIRIDKITDEYIYVEGELTLTTVIHMTLVKQFITTNT